MSDEQVRILRKRTLDLEEHLMTLQERVQRLEQNARVRRKLNFDENSSSSSSSESEDSSSSGEDVKDVMASSSSSSSPVNGSD